MGWSIQKDKIKQDKQQIKKKKRDKTITVLDGAGRTLGGGEARLVKRVDGGVYDKVDGGIDGGVDGRVDIGVDVLLNGVVDGGVDGGIDGGLDGGVDVGVDGEVDVGLDGVDGGEDVGVDGGVDGQGKYTGDIPRDKPSLYGAEELALGR